MNVLSVWTISKTDKSYARYRAASTFSTRSALSNGFRATMIIETTREDREPIEKTLYDYRQVPDAGFKPGAFQGIA